jgi:hypothetical protein
LPTFLYVRWKCFNCGTVNLSSGAGGEDVRCDRHQVGASEDRPADSGHQGVDLPHDQHVLGINNSETLVCNEHQQAADREVPNAFAVTERYSEMGVMVTIV